LSRPRVCDLLTHLGAEVPWSWAESWDRVGLLAGDPSSPVTGVLVSLDPTPEALDRTLALGASVLLTHHPAYLDAIDPCPGTGMRGVAFRAISSGIALIAAHTNLDRCPEGADALPEALGLRIIEPLERSRQPVQVIVTYAPVGHADAVRRAMTEAGAGRIGAYEACTFTGEGTGRFTPMLGAGPGAGSTGEPRTADEVRIEAVCPPDLAEYVAVATRAAHPYEEPVILRHDGAIERGAARMGRLCEASPATSVAGLACAVGRTLGVRPRVWGGPDRVVKRVATAHGSGRSLVGSAVRAGADALVTGELRYHDALDATAAGLAVIEAGHDATEWPMVPVLAEMARRTEGLPGSRVFVDAARAGWWTTEGD
jgi:dinuclear metal center YbgI/SA1388 family protein